MPDCEKLQYCGRIDFDNPRKPVFVFPGSYVKVKFFGKKVEALVKNKNYYWDNFLGVLVDGIQTKIKLDMTEDEQKLLLFEGEAEGEHELTLFKRQDACHVFEFCGFIFSDGAKLLELPKPWSRRMEVYGDSVSAGEVSEAADYCGKEDPQHNGEFSNSYESYASIAARKLNAQLHSIAQGGIALMKGTGWYFAPNYLGMEDIYDKIEYPPYEKKQKVWDFTAYIPHVVIVAIGQNDKNPWDFMKEDFYGEKALEWRSRYKNFVKKLREHYPKAEIILTTTILFHDASWDEAIELVCRELADEKVHHFLYQRNGTGTPGHIRKAEAEEMANELCSYIESLGEEIWRD